MAEGFRGQHFSAKHLFVARLSRMLGGVVYRRVNEVRIGRIVESGKQLTRATTVEGREGHLYCVA